MQQSFEIKIPSLKVQNAWDDLDSVDDLTAKELMDEFNDCIQANMSEIMRKFSGKKVSITVETIK